MKGVPSASAPGSGGSAGSRTAPRLSGGWLAILAYWRRTISATRQDGHGYPASMTCRHARQHS